MTISPRRFEQFGCALTLALTVLLVLLVSLALRACTASIAAMHAKYDREMHAPGSTSCAPALHAVFAGGRCMQAAGKVSRWPAPVNGQRGPSAGAVLAAGGRFRALVARPATIHPAPDTYPGQPAVTASAGQPGGRGWCAAAAARPPPAERGEHPPPGTARLAGSINAVGCRRSCELGTYHKQASRRAMDDPGARANAFHTCADKRVNPADGGPSLVGPPSAHEPRYQHSTRTG